MFVETVSECNVTSENISKKHQFFGGFQVWDLNISDISYKSQNLNWWLVCLVIALAFLFFLWKMRVLWRFLLRMRVLCRYINLNTRICGSTRIYAGIVATLHTVKCILWKAYCERHTVKCILWNHTVKSILWNSYSEIHTLKFILWIAYCDCILWNSYFEMHSVKRIMRHELCDVHTVKCILWIHTVKGIMKCILWIIFSFFPLSKFVFENSY